MPPDALFWIAGGYLMGTFPSTWLVARATGRRAAIAGSRRDRGEDDAHIVVGRRIGPGWAALAATADVAKGLAWSLLARHAGDLPNAGVALAATAVAVGHAFPFYLRAMSGRGLATTAGVYLALLPLPMIVAGLTMCAGFLIRQSGLMSTIGFAGVPAVAWIQGQPAAFVAMAAAMFALILIRRVEGAGAAARETGLSWGKAALYRALFDSTGPPGDPSASAARPDRATP